MTLEAAETGPLMPKLLPDTDKMVKCTILLPPELWARLKEIERETKKGGKPGHDRQEIARRFLTWAIQEWDAERKKLGGK